MKWGGYSHRLSIHYNVANSLQTLSVADPGRALGTCASLSVHQILSFSCSFRQTFYQIIGWRTSFGVWAPLWKILGLPLVDARKFTIETIFFYVKRFLAGNDRWLLIYLYSSFSHILWQVSHPGLVRNVFLSIKTNLSSHLRQTLQKPKFNELSWTSKGYKNIHLKSKFKPQ